MKFSLLIIYFELKLKNETAELHILHWFDVFLIYQRMIHIRPY